MRLFAYERFRASYRRLPRPTQQKVEKALRLLAEHPRHPSLRRNACEGKMLVMDFEQALKTLLEGFDRLHIRYAVCGGFALGVLGVPRATADIDFLVHRDDLEALHGQLTAMGYTRAAQTANVSHYRHADRVWGAVDILHAFRQYSLEMLERVRSYPIFDGSLTAKVLQPEDVIGFKIQAMANNPLRLVQEQADIEALASHYRDRLDWKRVQGYYDLFDRGEEGRRLRERFGHAQ